MDEKVNVFTAFLDRDNSLNNHAMKLMYPAPDTDSSKVGQQRLRTGMTFLYYNFIYYLFSFTTNLLHLEVGLLILGALGWSTRYLRISLSTFAKFALFRFKVFSGGVSIILNSIIGSSTIGFGARITGKF